jgi:hypothetical protein
MRSGFGACDWKMGGAWQCAATARAWKSTPSNFPGAGTTANTRGEGETPCIAEGCTKGTRIVGMVLQQSWPRW